jgi:hypothetical protein
MARSEDVKTPECILGYAKDLFDLRERDSGSKGYGCTLFFSKVGGKMNPALAPLQKAAVDAAVAEWGDKAIQWIKDEVIKTPFLDGDGKQGKDDEGKPKAGHPGTHFIRCTSGEDFKPKVVDRKRLPIVDKADCPSGSRVFAVVNAYTWDNPKNGKGISFGISLVQVTKKAEGDEILGGAGGPDPDKFFDKIDDEGEAPASTKSGAGAAGLFG